MVNWVLHATTGSWYVGITSGKTAFPKPYSLKIYIMSDIRFNNWKHQSGTGGVTQNSGGNVGIGSTLPIIET